MHSMGDVIVGFGLLIIGLGIYFLPTIIAFSRGHVSKLAIVLVNLFFGWSVFGWLIALIWSLADSGSNNQIIVNNANHQGERSPPIYPQESKMSNVDFELLAQRTAEKMKQMEIANGTTAQNDVRQIEHSAPAVNQARRICPACHSSIEPSDKFCATCGFNLQK